VPGFAPRAPMAMGAMGKLSGMQAGLPYDVRK
jgi:hypothetical protein